MTTSDTLSERLNALARDLDGLSVDAGISGDLELQWSLVTSWWLILDSAHADGVALDSFNLRKLEAGQNV